MHMGKKAKYFTVAIAAVLGLTFYIYYRGNGSVKYVESGGVGLVSTTWSDHGYAKTTGGHCEIRFQLEGGDDSDILISDRKFSVIGGNEANVGGWVKVSRRFPKRIQLHLFLDYGTFSIEHPCNGKWAY
jgi:hypothetical protein